MESAAEFAQSHNILNPAIPFARLSSPFIIGP